MELAVKLGFHVDIQMVGSEILALSQVVRIGYEFIELKLDVPGFGGHCSSQTFNSLSIQG